MYEEIKRLNRKTNKTMHLRVLGNSASNFHKKHKTQNPKLSQYSTASDEDLKHLLSKNRKEVALREIKGNAPDENVSGFFVFSMPGSVSRDSQCGFCGVDFLYAFNQRQRIHGEIDVGIRNGQIEALEIEYRRLRQLNRGCSWRAA